MREGCIPDDWRTANIVPIFKAGSRSKAENYRPVSLTSQICKVFESLIRDVIVDHLEANNLLNITQHGFRKGRSCLTNILSFLEEVTEGLDRKK
jgi:predicted transcriptional regulator